MGEVVHTEVASISPEGFDKVRDRRKSPDEAFCLALATGLDHLNMSCFKNISGIADVIRCSLRNLTSMAVKG